MTRLQALDPAEVSGKTKELFDAVQGKLGVIPNMMRTMANSPALLEGYLNFSGALERGVLSTKTREFLALAIGESNSCDYCVSVHSYLSENLLKQNQESILAARLGNATDAKTDALLKLARVLVKKNGNVADEDVNAAKNAGVSEAEIAETIGHVGLNILTNYFNNTAKTQLDFPEVVAL
jgi:uncharacterized peroxidase-related enzyme